MGLLHRVVSSTLPLVPTPLMRLLAAPYIAGETLDDALRVLTTWAERGHPGALDVLGEDVRDEATARDVAATYRAGASALAERGLDCYVSIKPTHVGLGSSEDLCLELYDEVCAHAGELGLFVRVEMEDHPTTDATLRVFDALRRRHANVGIVLQSRLFRTPADVDALTAVEGAGPLDVRIVKGIYLEPEAIAHTAADPIRDAYVDLSRTLLERGATVRFATHDGPMAERLFDVVRDLDVPRERYELQVLLGVQETLWSRWREGGHTVRVYVPYGPEWRAYSQRRLRKNPQVLGHVMRATFTRPLGR